MTSRHVSVWVDVAPDVAYAIAADPQQLPRWASGLAESALRQTADGWVADSPMGEVIVEFAPPNEFGVLDHVVRMPSGEAVYNPLRVIPAGEGQRRCEVVFTVRRRAGMTDEEFENFFFLLSVAGNASSRARPRSWCWPRRCRPQRSPSCEETGAAGVRRPYPSIAVVQ